MNITPNDFYRIMRRVEKTSTCWLWRGAFCGSKPYWRYGQVWIQGQNRIVHRVLYELLKGPILEGLQIDHLCRVTECVNPHHLEAVTGRTNTLRGNTIPARNAKKTTCPQGHPYSKININGRRCCRICEKVAWTKFNQKRGK
jgi:hypothetical protein